MERESFEALVADIRSAIDGSDALLREMSAKDVVDEDFLERIQPEARKLLSKLTSFLQTDLYHVIAMGRPTAAQMSSLAKLTREASLIKRHIWSASEYHKGNHIAKMGGKSIRKYKCHCGGIVMKVVVDG